MSLRLVVIAMMVTTAMALGMIAYRMALPPAVTMLQMPAPVPLPTAGYLVAARPLPAGTLARDEDFNVRTVRPDEVPQGALSMGPDVLVSIRGGLIRRYLDAGAPITFADILRPRDRGFLAAVLSPGTRAISVGEDAVTGVAGLIWPGDRVDVILTQQMDQNNPAPGRRVVSETVLTDIRVIAVDQEIVQGASDTTGVAGKVARTVTLQVTQDEAERIAVAQRLGMLALAIRAIADAPDVQSYRPSVFGDDVSPALSASGDRPGSRVEVIEGDKRTDVTFR